MERITRNFIEFIREHKRTRIINFMEKNKKEVNINGNGTHRYMIKEGENKGKVL